MKFKPFEKVLVRDFESNVWRANFFSHYNNDKEYKYACVYNVWKYCILFKKNEHLLGTNKCYNKKELSLFQKVIAWNTEDCKIKGYFLEIVTFPDGYKFYKIIDYKNKSINFFENCIIEEWEE